MSPTNFARACAAMTALVVAAACHRSSGGSTSLDQVWAAAPARPDAFGVASVPDLDFGPFGTDYQLDRGAALIELANGRAHLRAVVRSASAPENAWQVGLDLARRLSPSDALYASHADPRAHLADGAYVANGGLVDPATWRYFELDGGELLGLDALAGARARVTSPTRWAVQVGAGASNLSLEPGVEALVTVEPVSQPNEGATFPTAAFDTAVRFALRSSAEHVAHDPRIDPALAAPSHGALEVPGIGTFRIVAGGELVERLDGTARLDAQVVDVHDDARRFEVELVGSRRIDVATGASAPAGFPLRELPLEAYREHGGDVDVRAWHYYTKVAGELRGVGALEGARIGMTSAARLQVGRGAHGASLELGLTGRIALRTTRQSLAGPDLPWNPPDAMLRIELAREYVACALDAVTDSQYSAGPTVALIAPDLGGRFVFAAGGTLSEHLDGTAGVRGILAAADDPANRWQIEVDLAGRVDAEQGEAFPPAGSPELDLAPGAYVENGGVVDPAKWHYYTQLSGQLVGLGANSGTRIGISRSGAAVQVGIGASGRNLRGGAIAKVGFELVQAGGGSQLAAVLADGELCFEIHRGCQQCATEAVVDPATTSVAGGFALALGGVASDLVFDGPARLIERADGSGRLEGTLVLAGDGAPRFELVLEMRERVDPGAAAFPPEGSPRLELVPDAYDHHGGVVSPSTWHYFRVVEGTLAGLGPWEGARIALTRSGLATQLGLGASGRNTDYGASSTLAVTVIAQPKSGPALAPSGDASLAIDLVDTCD